jgi:hypothetical protein
MREAGPGKILVAKCVKKSGDKTTVKQINVQNEIPRFYTGGKQHTKIILPVKLTTETVNKPLTPSQVNDMLLHGQKEVNEHDPLITVILRAWDKDTRLVHAARELSPQQTIVDAKKLDQEPRAVQIYNLSDKACSNANCSFCFSESEIGTIPDYQSQQSVFL